MKMKSVLVLNGYEANANRVKSAVLRGASNFGKDRLKLALVGLEQRDNKMEYEFRRNSVTGTFLASFSMDHEVLGQWFTEELGPELAKIQQVLDIIREIQTDKRGAWRLVGNDFTLELEREQARVFANTLGFEQEYELEEAMSLYDAESEAYCGLEDFELALLSWQTFIEKGL